jgi:adenosylhomocysteine nucleosidase
MHKKWLALCELIVLGALLGACRPTQQVSPVALVTTPCIAVLSAYQPELEELLARAEIAERQVINGRTYHLGRMAGRDIVLLTTGVSMVNAAMTTQTVLDHFNVTAIIFSGIAGGVNPELNIGDVVVPAQWGQYQEQVFARQTAQGWDTGWASQDFGNYGMMFPQTVSIAREGSRPDNEENRFWFPVDSKMLEEARKISASVKLEKCAPLGRCLGNEPKIAVGGNGVSGPTFVDNAEYRTWVWQTFQADALDMEMAAVAHVAYVNNIPFIAFRSLSDLAGGGPGQNEIDIFFQLAAKNSAQALAAFLEAWPVK